MTPETEARFEAWRNTIGYQALTAFELDYEDPVADLERRLSVAFRAGIASERARLNCCSECGNPNDAHHGDKRYCKRVYDIAGETITVFTP